MRVAEKLTAAHSEHDDATGVDGGGEVRVAAKVCPKRWKTQMRGLMHELFGVDLMRVPGVGFEAALTLLSEVGCEISAFPDSNRFGQWLGLAPGTNISGGKRLAGANARGCEASGQALRMSALTLRRDASELGDAHRYRCARIDPPRAIKATAYQLARIIFAMVTDAHEYSDQPLLEAIHQLREKKVARLIRQARGYGLKILENDAEVHHPSHAVTSGMTGSKLLSDRFVSRKYRALNLLVFSPIVTASYAIPVRQASGLPSASFRFCFTAHTLAVRLTVPLVGPVADLHRRVIRPPPRVPE